MADNRRFLDVWILETNTVYREVPYSIVADWVQQGRLLEEDQVRPAGTVEWSNVGDSSTLTPYLPKSEPQAVEDRAEALEPVSLGFAWKPRPADEGDDVDMIPLIDVSLVLLIFFMMTATAVTTAAVIKTPATIQAHDVTGERGIWIGIDCNDGGDPTVFLLGEGEGGQPLFKGPDLAPLLAQLDARLEQAARPVKVTILAHENIKSGVVRDLIIELGKRGRAKVEEKRIGVSEKRT